MDSMDENQREEVPPLVLPAGNCSKSSNGSTEDRQQDFQRNLQEQVAAAQQGHKGLENALHLICERLLDLEGCWKSIRKEKKITETKYDELRRDCIERQQQLAGLNSNLRKDLSQLEARLDQLPEPTPPDNSVGPLSPSCGLPNGAATNSDNMREELMALRKKVDIVAANVLGEAEGIGKDRPNTSNSISKPTTSEDASLSPQLTPILVEQNGIAAEHCVDPDVGAEAQDSSAQDQKRKMMSEEVAEGDGVSPARRAQARRCWGLIRENRKFLVKKMRRQAMAEEKVSHAETIITRVERLEQALGVNAYTKGAGRLDILAHDVRISLGLIVEHQARAASDALSAPLSFLPAEAGDLSLLSLALPQLNSGSGGSHVTSMAQCQPSSSVGICKDGGGRGNGNSGEKGDTGWLYIAEDRGYLCVDLLLGRTLRELAEGLAFAASHVYLLEGSAMIGQLAVAEEDISRKSGRPSSLPTDGPGFLALLKNEMERTQNRCERLSALVVRLRREGGQEDEDGGGALLSDTESPPAAAKASEILRLCCALAGDMQYLLSHPDYCRVFEVFSFTPKWKCLCDREFEEATRYRRPPSAATGGGPEDRPSRSKSLLYPSSSESPSEDAAGGETEPGMKNSMPGAARSFHRHQEGATMSMGMAGVGKYRRTSSTGAPPSSGRSGAGADVSDEIGSAGGRDVIGRTQQQKRHHRMSSVCVGERGNTNGFRVRPTLYQCMVFSLGHISSFLSTVRSRVAHRATALVKRDFSEAEGVARDAEALARSALAVAKQASAEALSATAEAAEVAVGARNEGSILLEELHVVETQLIQLHWQLAEAIKNERGRLEMDNDARAKTERERVGNLLETQLGHLKSLLDSKVGQEDLSAMTKAMGDVEETLTIVRESLPGQNAMSELQEALSQKADKSYTKRQMGLLVVKVSALLRDEVDEPTLAKKKCLSCDRVFNKLSFRELSRQLPDVLEGAGENAALGGVHEGGIATTARDGQDRQYFVSSTCRPSGGAQATSPTSGLARNSGGVDGANKEGRPGSVHAAGERKEGGWSPCRVGKRPGSAPSSRSRSSGELRPNNNSSNTRFDRPSSARLGGSVNYRWNTGTPPGTADSFRPSSARLRGRGLDAQFSSQQSSQLFSTMALSAAMAPFPDGVRKAVGAEAARAERAVALEPTPAPDNLRYGGMTTAPLVKQLFASISGKTDNNGRGGTRGSTIGRGDTRGGRFAMLGGGRGGTGTRRGDIQLDVPSEIAQTPWEIRAGGARDSQQKNIDRVLSPMGTGGALRSVKLIPTRNGGGIGAVNRGEARGVQGGEIRHGGGFSSMLEHHRRNVLSATVPQVIGGPLGTIRGSNGGEDSKTNGV